MALFDKEKNQGLFDAAKKKAGEMLSEEAQELAKKVSDSLAEEAQNVIQKVGDSATEAGTNFINKVGESATKKGTGVVDTFGETVNKLPEAANKLLEEFNAQKKEIEEKGYSDKAYEVAQNMLSNAVSLPIVHVDREEFLRKNFGSSPYIDKILKDGPQSVFTVESLRKKADDIIKNSTRKTAMASFAAGLASSPIATVAATAFDLTQYFGVALNLAQKIAYLFGEDDLFAGFKSLQDDLQRKDGTALPEDAQMRMISWIGAMMGVSGAGGLILKTSQQAGVNIGKKVAAQALTKTTWYPLVKKVGSIIGIKITKKSVESAISKALPVIGGFISGGMTFASFNPMGGRLADVFVRMLNGDFDLEMELNPDFLAELEEMDKEMDATLEKVADAIDVEFQDVEDSTE